ncbi:MAG: WD40 repeat domain-containing serine/threonine-protein kinase [Gemmatales bacterium]
MVDNLELSRELPQETVAGRYRATAHLGQGGLGQVFIAVDEELEREVALKRILPGRAAGEDNRARFRREARITGRLEHPGIVPIYGLGSDSQGRPYYAMRRVTGDTLDEAINRYHRNELSLPVLLRSFLAICQTVAFAHSKGIIHRDLKPQNVLLGEFGETLVIDWGLAKPLAEVEADDAIDTGQPSMEGVTPTMHGARKGSPAYMSPEQADGQPATEASDIYALGATLYKILSGRAPFSDTADIWQRIRTGDFPSPRSLQANVPAALDAVCRKAMAVRREDRYATALELAADIEHWVADEPVSAARDPFTVRCRRWVRRHRALVLSALSMFAVGIASLVVLLIMKDQSNRALTQSNDDLKQANNRVENTLVETERERDRARDNLRESRRNNYLTLVNLAAVSLAENKYPRAIDLLRRSSPRPGETDDFRSFEWYYLTRLFATEYLEVEGPPSPASVAVSSDRRWLASSSGRLVSVYSIATGKLVMTAPVTPYSTQISFSPDSSLLAIPDGKTIALWKFMGDRCERGSTIPSFDHRCAGFAFSPQGDLLAASGDGGRLSLFNPRSGEMLADSKEMQGAKPLTDPQLDYLSFSSESSRLAGVKLLEPIIFDIRRQNEALTLALSYRGAKNQQATHSWFEGKQNDLSIEYSGQIIVFDRFQEERRKMRLPDETRYFATLPTQERPSYLALSKGVAWLLRTPVWKEPAGGIGSGILRFGESLTQPLPFEQPVKAIGVSVDGKTAAFGLADGRIIVRNPFATEPQVFFRHEGSGAVTAVHLSSNSKNLLSTDSTGDVVFGELQKEPTFRFEAKKKTGLSLVPPAVSIAMASDGSKYAIRNGNRIDIVNAATGKPTLTIPFDFGTGLFQPTISITFSPDGSRLAWTVPTLDIKTLKTTTTKILEWSLTENRETFRFPMEGKVSALAYSPLGTQLAMACDDGVKLRRTDGAGVIRQLPGEGPFVVLCFTADGSRIAAGTSSGSVRIWSVVGSDVGEAASLHGSSITGLGFFPDGRLLATSGEDGFIKLFDTVDRIERGSFSCGIRINSLAVATDGGTMVAGCDRGICLAFHPTNDASIVRMYQTRCTRSPDNPEAWRDLSVLAWGWYLERHRTGDETTAMKALEIGKNACEKLKALPEAESWFQAFQLALEKYQKKMPSNAIGRR